MHILFVQKDGAIVDHAIIRQRFFEYAVDAGVKVDHASAVWEDAMQGDDLARDLIEDLCDVEIVRGDAGFGF